MKDTEKVRLIISTAVVTLVMGGLGLLGGSKVYRVIKQKKSNNYTQEVLGLMQEMHDKEEEDFQDATKPMVGMRSHHVIKLWGTPTNINRTESQNSKTEQWVYRRGGQKTKYVHFRNGRVTSIKD